MYQEAADLLHISQPALSKHIQKIEDELHITLFDRTTRNVKLCKGGTIFYDYAKRMIDMYDECSRTLNDVRTQDKKKLVIGYPSSLGQYRIPALLAKFIYCYPDVNMEIINDREPRLTEYLQEKKLHFLFTTQPLNESNDISKQLYVADTLCILLPYDHPMASLPYVTFDQLRNEEFVLQGSLSPETREIYRCCKKAGFEPRVIAQSNFRSNAVEMVRCGIGITLMGHKYAQAFNMDGLVLIDIKPQMSRSVYLQYYKKIQPGSNEDLFLQYYETESGSFAFPNKRGL